jgi:cobalt-precorrin 5A hydrolase
MVVGKTMIVAGIGSRKGVSTAEVLAAVEAALEAHGLSMDALSALATTAFKRKEEAIFAAGRELGLPVMVVEDGNSNGSLAWPIPPSAIAGDSSGTPAPPSPLRGGVRGGGMKAALSSDLPQKEGGSEAIGVVSTPTLYPSPQGGGGRQRRASSACPAPASTHSELSQTVAGVPSVSEAAALAAAGDGARLLGPRIVVGPVTCALATSKDAA